MNQSRSDGSDCLSKHRTTPKRLNPAARKGDGAELSSQCTHIGAHTPADVHGVPDVGFSQIKVRYRQVRQQYCPRVSYVVPRLRLDGSESAVCEGSRDRKQKTSIWQVTRSDRISCSEPKNRIL